MDVKEALTTLGGAARRKDLLAAGVRESKLRKAVAFGAVSVPVRGVLALPGADPAILAACTARAHLACISAAEARGLWVLRQPGRVHVSADHGRPLGDHFRVHRAAGKPGMLEICIQCLRCLPELDALCIVESAVVKGLIRQSFLLENLGGQRDKSLRRIVRMIDPHAQSIVETVSRYHLRHAGYITQSQVFVPGAGRLDLMVDGVLGIEVDGKEYHSARTDFEEDRRRWNVYTVRGISVLRVTYPLLVHSPDKFLELVAGCLTNFAQGDG